MQAQPQSQYQEELVRGLAHRMNNILTIFNGYVGLMLENQSLDDATRDGLCRIKAGARAATELMDRTHALVRQPNIVWRQIDLGDFLRTIQPAIASMSKPAVPVEIHAPAGLPKVWADSTRLRTAVLELVRNAVEATPKGESLQLILSRTTAPHDLSLAKPDESLERVALAVIDHGAGIPPELEAKIFVPFFSTKRKQDANGLGLNVAQGLIEKCGGSLQYQSRPGETKFEVLLRTEKPA